jgi:hypothetical protein
MILIGGMVNECILWWKAYHTNNGGFMLKRIIAVVLLVAIGVSARLCPRCL